MPHIDRETVLKEVSQFYLNSRDFNGIPAEALANKCGVDWFDLQEILRCRSSSRTDARRAVKAR